MAVVQLVAVVLVLALVRPWSRRVPAWLLLFPVWVGTGLLFQVVVGSAILLGLSSTASQESGTATGGIALWVYVVVYASFAVQGVALAIAFGCHVRAGGAECWASALAMSSRGQQPDRGCQATSRSWRRSLP